MSPGVSLPALVLLGQDLPCLRAALMQEFPCQQPWNQAGWSHHGWCYRTPWQGFSPWEQRAKGKGSIPPKYKISQQGYPGSDHSSASQPDVLCFTPNTQHATSWSSFLPPDRLLQRNKLTAVFRIQSFLGLFSDSAITPEVELDTFVHHFQLFWPITIHFFSCKIGFFSKDRGF